MTTAYGLKVNSMTPVAEHPADVERGRTGIAVAGVGWLFGSALSSPPSAAGDFYIYDPVTDTWVITNIGSISGFLTRSRGEQALQSIIAASGAAATIDCSQGNIFDITLTANCTLTITNPPPALDGGFHNQTGQIAVILRQGGAGSYTVTWPASVKWRSSTGTNAGSAPTLYTAVGAEDVVLLSTADGGVTWGGTLLPHDSTATVSSVGLSMPAEFSVAGSPVTSAGTLAVTKANESANTVWAGPISGAAAAPTFRALVATDIPAGFGGDHEHVMDCLFSGDGSTTAWTLPAVPFDQYSVTAYVGGTLTEVTLSGTLFDIATFGSAPGSGTNNIRFDIVAAVA